MAQLKSRIAMIPMNNFVAICFTCSVIFDSDNSFDNHVAKVCRACYYHLRDLRRIHKFLGVETAILLANAMVSSRLDYCNSLLYGVSKSNIAKLQRVKNALCRIIFRLDKMSHVTPFLKKTPLAPNSTSHPV